LLISGNKQTFLNDIRVVKGVQPSIWNDTWFKVDFYVHDKYDLVIDASKSVEINSLEHPTLFEYFR